MADLLGSEELEKFRKLRAAQQKTWGIQPDSAANDRRTAKQLGVPTQAVEDARDFSIQEAAFKQMWQETEGLGTLRGKMAEPEFHAMAKDDVEKLAGVESAAGQYLKQKHGTVAAAPEDGFLTDVVHGVRRGYARFKANMGLQVSGWDIFGQEKAARAHGMGGYRDVGRAVRFQNDLRRADRFAPDATLQRKQKAMARINQSGTLWEAALYALNNPDAVFNTTAESLGYAAPGLAMTMAGFVAGGAVGGATTAGITSAGSEYAAVVAEVAEEHAAELGGMSETQKLAYVLGREDWMAEAREKGEKRGLAIGAFDAMTAGVAGRMMAGAKPTVSSMASRALGEVGVQAAGGAAGEATAQALTGEYKPMDIVMEAFAEIPTGMVEGGGNYRHARARYAAEEAQRAEEALAQAEHLQAQSEQMGQSRLATRAPDVAAEYVNEVYGAQAQIYIDGDALQQSGMADKVAELMPDKADAVAEAVATGGMLELTRGDFHTVLNQPDVQSALLPHVRVRPDALTAAEAQALRDSDEGRALAGATEAAVQEEAQETEAAAEAEARKQGFAAVLDTVRQQLADTGRYTPEQARINATLAASYYQATADRMGMAVTDLFAQRPLQVTGEALDGGMAQALAANPPRGWVHAEDGAAAADLWNGNSAAQAVFWTQPNAKLEEDFPELAGYSVSIDAGAIQHIREHHGKPKTETARGQIAITENDIARIKEVASDYDAVRFEPIGGTNNKRMALAKLFEDGVLLLIADTSKKRRDLRTVSMWKFPQSDNVQSIIDNAVSLSRTPETKGGISHIDNDTAIDSDVQQDILFQTIYENERDKIARALDKMGLPYQVDDSRVSNSAYVTVYEPAYYEWFTGDGTVKNGQEVKYDSDPNEYTFKVRISDHELPLAYKLQGLSADFEVLPRGAKLTNDRNQDGSSHTDGSWADAVEKIAEKFNRPIPAAAKRVLNADRPVKEAQAKKKEEQHKKVSRILETSGVVNRIQTWRHMKGAMDGLENYKKRDAISFRWEDVTSTGNTASGDYRSGLIVLRRKTGKRGAGGGLIVPFDAMDGLEPLPNPEDKGQIIDWLEINLPLAIRNEAANLLRLGVDVNRLDHDINDSGFLYQQSSFDSTAATLGEEAAYEAAKAAGATELTYRQWVQVRTPEFKAWFGDWENDPDNASRAFLIDNIT